MGLIIKLSPGERLIVNGSIIRNGDRSSRFEVENLSDVLRGNEILAEAQCTTPVLRLQGRIQMALVSRDNRDELVVDIMSRLHDLEQVLGQSCAEHIFTARKLINEGQFYAAFRALKPVARHEEVLLEMPVGHGIGGNL